MTASSRIVRSVLLGVVVALLGMCVAQSRPDPFAGVTLQKDAVQCEPPSGPVELAKPVEINLTTKHRGPLRVSSYQRQKSGNPLVPPDFVYGSDGEVSVQHHSDGSAYVTVVPLRLGDVQLTLSGLLLQEKIMFIQHMVLHVQPGSEPPKKLTANRQSIFFLAMDRPDSYQWVGLQAVYDGVRFPIEIDASFARFNLFTHDPTAAVTIDDATGRLTAVHTGHVLLRTEFGGKSMLTCVIVDRTSKDLAPDRDLSGCQDLLAPGERLTDSGPPPPYGPWTWQQVPQ